jgi:hypothetical protein
MPVLESEIGVCTVEEESCAPNSAGIASRLSWRPQETLQKQLPTNFCLSLALLRDAEGHRRLVPSGGVEAFFLEASLLGQVILEFKGRLDVENSQSIDAQRWVFQQRKWLRETFKRTFKRESDLRISASGQSGCRHVLPEALGRNHHSTAGWTVDEFLTHGSDLAREWGIENPDTQARIRFGLLQAAMNNPSSPDEASPDERVNGLRWLLFDDVLEFESEQVASVRTYYDRICERLAVAIHKHRNDTTERFGDWLIMRSDGVIHQIAKAKRDGGTIPQAMVRECRIQMILDSYQSMSQCIHVAMLEIRKFLPHDFTQRELDYFDVLYRRQPELGMLPLILLRDHLCKIGFDPLTIPIPDFSPSVFFTLLHFYSEMTRNRRAGDRGYKRKFGTSVVSRKPEWLQEFVSTKSTPALDAVVNEELHFAAQRLSVYLGWACSCDDPSGHHLTNSEYNAHTIISADICCQNCSCRETVDFTPEIQLFLASQADVT